MSAQRPLAATRSRDPSRENSPEPTFELIFRGSKCRDSKMKKMDRLLCEMRGCDKPRVVVACCANVLAYTCAQCDHDHYNDLQLVDGLYYHVDCDVHCVGCYKDTASDVTGCLDCNAPFEEHLCSDCLEGTDGYGGANRCPDCYVTWKEKHTCKKCNKTGQSTYECDACHEVICPGCSPMVTHRVHLSASSEEDPGPTYNILKRFRPTGVDVQRSKDETYCSTCCPKRSDPYFHTFCQERERIFSDEFNSKYMTMMLQMIEEQKQANSEFNKQEE